MDTQSAEKRSSQGQQPEPIGATQRLERSRASAAEEAQECAAASKAHSHQVRGISSLHQAEHMLILSMIYHYIPVVKYWFYWLCALQAGWHAIKLKELESPIASYLITSS